MGIANYEEQRDLELLNIFPKFEQTVKNMRTLNVTISDIEYNKFGIKEEKLSFTDIVDLVSKELTRQNLSRCIELADKYGISNMTMDEITNEVKAVRSNAKNRS